MVKKSTTVAKPVERYLLVENAWGYQPVFVPGDSAWNWMKVGAWFEAMLKEEYPGKRAESYYHQSKHSYLVVKLPKSVKNVSHFYGKHYYREFLTNRPDNDKKYATIFPYNYAAHNDPAIRNWTEKYDEKGEEPPNSPLRSPYPIPEPTRESPKVDDIWASRVSEETYERLAQRYAQAHPERFVQSPLVNASTFASGSGQANSFENTADPASLDAADALLSSILPRTPTIAKNEEGDVKPLVVKREERKFKVDEDVKLPPELICGSVGYSGSRNQIKPEPHDPRVKMDEEEDRKPFIAEMVDLPPELINGSIFGPVPSKIKIEQGGIHVKPESMEYNMQDSVTTSGRYNSFASQGGIRPASVKQENLDHTGKSGSMSPSMYTHNRSHSTRSNDYYQQMPVKREERSRYESPDRSSPDRRGSYHSRPRRDSYDSDFNMDGKRRDDRPHSRNEGPSDRHGSRSQSGRYESNDDRRDKSYKRLKREHP